MAKRMSPERQAAFDEIVRSRRLAQNKKSSLRRNGVELNGTKFDPIRDLSVVRNYNLTQMKAYSHVLRTFRSRESRFMSTDQGIAGPAVVNKFLTAERKLNAQKRKALADIGDVVIPGSAETFKERLGVVDPKHRRMADPASDNPFKPSNRRGVRFRSPKKIAELARKMEKEATPGFRAKVRNRNRSTLDKMFTKLNMPKAVAAIRALGPRGFDVLFYDPKFMNHLGLQYGMSTADMSDDQKPFYDAIMDGAETAILDLVEVVAKQELDGKSKSKNHPPIQSPRPRVGKG